MSSTAAHAAGAGANAARKDLVPSAPSGRPGKGAGKGAEQVNDASEPTASGTAGSKVREKSPAVSESPKSGAAEPEVDEKDSEAEEVLDRVWKVKKIVFEMGAKRPGRHKKTAVSILAI